MPGVTAIVYDQTCAAEKRRRRKRGRFPDPPKRVFINDLVCEGCGDCSKTSNCVSVMPVETEFGRKRAIDQSSCNKDYSCVEGFCPSFVTVHGGGLRTPPQSDLDEDRLPPLPEPVQPPLAEPYGILVTGVGGTGVVTIGALLGMAAHLEGKGVTVLDMTGLAQKGGAVYSHVRIARAARGDPCGAHRRRRRAAAAWAATSSSRPAPRRSSKLAPGSSRAIVNSHETITGDFTRNPDLAFPTAALQRQHRRRDRSRKCRVRRCHAARDRPARRCDRHQSVHARLRLSAGAGAGVGRGDRAGDRAERRRRRVQSRRLSLGPARGARSGAGRGAGAAARGNPAEPPLSATLDEVIERRAAFLAEYQDAVYAGRYAGAHRAAARGRDPMPARQHRIDRSGRPRALQADGLQGRIRGRPALHRERLSGARRAPVRRPLPAAFSSGAADPRSPRPR